MADNQQEIADLDRRIAELMRQREQAVKRSSDLVGQYLHERAKAHEAQREREAQRKAGK